MKTTAAFRRHFEFSIWKVSADNLSFQIDAFGGVLIVRLTSEDISYDLQLWFVIMEPSFELV